MFSLDASDAIAQRLKPLDPEALSVVLTGLLLSPEHHAHYSRIYTLLHWALALADGQRLPTRGQLIELFGMMESHPARLSEDPPEELFTDEVWTDERRFRIFPGLYHGAAYHLQRLLICVDPGEAGPAVGVRRTLALLALSDALAERNGYVAGLPGDVSPRAPIRPDLRAASRRGETATFGVDDLAALGVSTDDLEPFILEDTSDLLSDMFGTTSLEHRPLVRSGSGVRVLSPPTLSAAARAHLVLALGPGAAERFYERDWIRWLAVDLPLAKAALQPAIELELSDPRWSASLSDRATSMRIDIDKQAHLIVLESRWPASINLPIPPPRGGGSAFRAALLTYAREARDQLCGDAPDAAGLTIIVHNSPGWSLDLGPPVALARRWFLVPMSAHAFSTLLQTPHFKLLDLWKLHAQLAELVARGRPIHMHQEALTQWSLWEELGFTFTPRSHDVREGGYLVDGGTVGPFVALTRAFRAIHGVPAPAGNLALVERLVDPDGSLEDLTKPLYYEPLEIAAGTLTGVVETDAGPWWVTVGRPPAGPEDRQFLYLLWQATLEWLVRAASTALARLTSTRPPLHVNLIPIPEFITDGPDVAEYSFSRQEVRILLPAGLMAQMVRADNAVEMQTLAWILEGLLRLAGADPDQADAWAREIMADPDFKMIHVTHEPDTGYAVDLSDTQLSPFRSLQRPELATAARWMDERLIARGVVAAVEPMKMVKGTAQVNDILKAAVDEHWDACRRRLSSLDRRSVVGVVMGLIEGLHRRRVVDERAARARGVAYREDPDLRARQSQERDHAFRTYRVVAEMALCTCPLAGGRGAGYSDIDAVAAEVATLVRVAEHSDAVQRGLIDAALVFLPDGSISLPRGDSGSFMEAYGRACIEESIRLDEDSYADRFGPLEREEEQPSAAEVGSGENDFECAVEAEFGLTLSTIAAVTAALQNVAVQRAEEAPRLRRSGLVDALRTEIGDREVTITPEAFACYLDAFALRPRAAWEKAPSGFTPDDIFPWFFERRLSLMTRPLVVLDETEDPEIQFGVRHLMMGVQYALMLLEQGIWPKAKLRSPEARSYVDREVDRRGKDFEAEVGAIFKQSGWTVESSIPMSQVGAGKAYGDIDVLAISPDGATWQIIECKWFGAARTPREVAAWMQDFHGHGGDKLDRHLKRFEWVRDHLAVFAKALGLSPPLRLEGRVVTTNPVPLAFVANLPEAAHVRTRRQLMAELGDALR